ncbi:MAG: hypothetical protein JJ978_11125 [Roseivirga sp.]|uniref:hypothetical protein n=1 Tax=Roseivirga sp. TaxID=1964215 RepID=UPI001B1E85B2|nr:hypothetical protein [Roseivirga sp.]MBO6496110.1 hypothetical protein [Roseivirga sp.]
MSNKDLTPHLKRIDFVRRYEALCKEHNDWNNRLRANGNEIYELVLADQNLDYIYNKKEKFYSTSYELEKGLEFVVTFGLMEGAVEPLINIKTGDGFYVPAGRMDFIPERIGEEFNRDLYNLPKFGSLNELKEILESIFTIVKDLQNAILED